MPAPAGPILALHIALGILSPIVFLPEVLESGSLFRADLLTLGDFFIGFLPYCCFTARNEKKCFPALLLYGFTGFFMSWIFGAQILIAVGFSWQILVAAVPCILVAVLFYLLIGFPTCALFRRLFARRRKD